MASGSVREDMVLVALKSALELDSYRWKEKGSVTETTRTLKEMLVSSTVENEASTNANMTALCTLTLIPSEEVESFEKLVRFCEECPSICRTEVVQVMYPLLVIVYIHFFSLGHTEQATCLNTKFFAMFESSQQAKLTELFSFSSTKELLASALVSKFMNKKYFLRMSDGAFQLLMQFLQILHTPFLLTLIQRYLAIEVYGNIPIDKQELKKTVTFSKPRSARVQGNRLLGKRTAQPRSSLSFPSLGAYTSPSVPSPVSVATRQAKNVKFREKLVALEAMDPQPTSVAICCVQHMDNGAFCGSINTPSMQYACGFADSSLHVWTHLPSSTHPSSCHMDRTTPIHPLPIDHQTLVGHSGPVYGACFNANGSFILSASEDCSVRLWDLQRGVCVVSYEGHTYPVWDVAFSPVDVHFASAGMDRTTRLWSTDLTYPLRIFAGHTSDVNVVKFHPNGQYLATGSHDRTCRLWDIQNGQCVRLLTGSNSPITSVAFSPNGRQLVGGGADGIIRIWDLGASSVLREYPPPASEDTCLAGAISALTFSPDGALLAASLSSCISIYDTRKFVATSSSNSVLEGISTLHLSPKSCSSVIQQQFTHCNCLVAITKSDKQTKLPPTTLN